MRVDLSAKDRQARFGQARLELRGSEFPGARLAIETECMGAADYCRGYTIIVMPTLALNFPMKSQPNLGSRVTTM